MNELFVDTKLPPPLEKEEIYSCFEKMKLGDLKAREKIINHNIRLVINEVTKKFENTPYEPKELVAVGLIGLIKGVDTFDITKGFEFATYSARCIDNEILMFIRKGKKYVKDISIDQTISEDNSGNELKVGDLISDEHSNFAKDYEKNESYKEIRKIVEKLPKREKDIVDEYFGFIGDKPLTQKEIADKLNLSQSYVSRIIKKVVKDISINLEALGIIEVKKEPRKKEEGSEIGEEGRNVVSRKQTTIYEYFSNYTKKQVDEAIKKLTLEEKKLITLRYGEDLENPNYTKWTLQNKNEYFGRVIPKMKKLLQNPNYGDKTKKEAKKDITSKELSPKLIKQTKEKQDKIDSLETEKEESRTQTLKKEDYIQILKLLKTPTFGEMLNILTPKEAIVICLNMGYIDEKYFKVESIAAFLEIEEEEVRESIKKVLLLYKENINDIIEKAVGYTTKKLK